jgi:methyl-accepting chemotaxis protein
MQVNTSFIKDLHGKTIGHVEIVTKYRCAKTAAKYDTVRKVSAGHELVEKNNAAFTDMTDKIGKASAVFAEIVSSAEEQPQGIEQINEAVNHIEGVSLDNTGGIVENRPKSNSVSKISN